MVFEIIDEPYRKNPRMNVEGQRLSRAFVAECERAFKLTSDFLTLYEIDSHDISIRANRVVTEIPKHISNQQRDEARRMRNNAHIILQQLHDLYKQRDKFDQSVLLYRVSYYWPTEPWYETLGVKTIEPLLERYNNQYVEKPSSPETQKAFDNITKEIIRKAERCLRVISAFIDVSKNFDPNRSRTVPSRGLLKKGSGKTTGVKKTAKPRKRTAPTKPAPTKRVTDVSGQFKKITGIKF